MSITIHHPEPAWEPEPGRECRVGEVPFRPETVCPATGLATGELLDGTGREVVVPLAELTPNPSDREALLRRIRSEEDPALFIAAEPALRARLLAWLNRSFQRAAGAYAHRSTSSLRAEFEQAEECSVTGGEMKGALLAAGFSPVNRFGGSWTFAMRRRRQSE